MDRISDGDDSNRNNKFIFYTVPKNRHASAFIVTLAAYCLSVSAILIGQIS